MSLRLEALNAAMGAGQGESVVEAQASGHLYFDREVLERLNAGGITLIVVTHDRDVGQRARRQLRMVDGRIVADARQ